LLHEVKKTSYQQVSQVLNVGRAGKAKSSNVGGFITCFLLIKPSFMNTLTLTSGASSQTAKLIKADIEKQHHDFFKDHCFYEVHKRKDGIKERMKANSYALGKECPPVQAFRLYSGKGKLHRVDWKKHDDFISYSEAKRNYELGQFFTPDIICKQLVHLLEIEPYAIVADIACGMGRFFNWLPGRQCIGREIDTETLNLAAKCFPEMDAKIENFEFCTIDTESADYCLGNPPYSIRFYGHFSNELQIGQSGIVYSENMYLTQTERILKKGGINAVLMPDYEFNESQVKKLNNFIDKKFWRISEIRLSLDSFLEYSRMDLPIKILILMKKHPFIKAPPNVAKIPAVKDFVKEFHKSEAGRWYYSIKRAIVTLKRQLFLKYRKF
jgi:hypothetical protein